MFRWFLEKGWYYPALAVMIGAGAWWSPHPFHEVSCLFVRVLPAKAPGHDKLLGCSNIEQKVSFFQATSIRDAEADVQGWRFYSATSETASVRVSVRKSSPEMVFYPRLSGISSRISIYEVLKDQRRLLYTEQGPAEGWSPIGRRMLLRIGCGANGWSEEEFPVELEIVLSGPGAQLWHKEGIVFFGR